jgi:peptide chain release factor 1
VSASGDGYIHMEVKGEDLTNLKKYECGGHRIQRIPPTEKRGRVQTSTVTVAVLEKQDSTLRVSENDLRVEWFSGTGNGGQHKNKHQNSCRLIHIPTGTTEVAQTRSRNNSLTLAREGLFRKLQTLTRRRVELETAAIRKEQVGSGMRGDKIRTYRFRDDTVTDHVTGKSAPCSKIMKGHFDLLW